MSSKPSAWGSMKSVLKGITGGEPCAHGCANCGLTGRRSRLPPVSTGQVIVKFSENLFLLRCVRAFWELARWIPPEKGVTTLLSEPLLKGRLIDQPSLPVTHIVT